MTPVLLVVVIGTRVIILLQPTPPPAPSTAWIRNKSAPRQITPGSLLQWVQMRLLVLLFIRLRLGLIGPTGNRALIEKLVLHREVPAMITNTARQESVFTLQIQLPPTLHVLAEDWTTFSGLPV